ncbi:MAG TPA: hypothetical protein VGL88_10515 [Pseudonocardiaceae bacterium]|jgi:hypothetical protein
MTIRGTSGKLARRANSRQHLSRGENVHTTSGLIVLAASLLLLLGVLIGYALTEQALQARAKKQAAMQQFLNKEFQMLAKQWEAIESARRGSLNSEDSSPRHGQYR